MIRFAFLFNPAARVWNLRLLLLCTVGILCYVIYTVNTPPYPIDDLDLMRALQITGFCLLFLHHVLVLVRWPFKGLAVVDLGLVLLEITALAYMLYRSFLVVDLVFFVSTVILLILSAVFRIATITTTKESIVRQEFVFLGSCAQTHPPYTPLRILLSRSIQVARPLVRGEARYIMFVRVIILSLIAIGAPAFAIYYIIITPLTTQIYTRDLATDTSPLTDAPPFSPSWSPPGNVTILFSRLDGNFIDDPASYKIQTHVATSEAVFECQPDSTAGSILLSVECPCEWYQIVNVSISLFIPPDAVGVYVTPVQGNLSPRWKEKIGVGSPALPLFPGSGLLGVFTWTRREFIAKTAVWASDTLDSTFLSGIATFGGFWTFLNGAFAIFFGENVIYFMFGRRPLSALGVVHIFQRRQLVRQWHEDFPAIHTEGGIPGTSSAGIVAFIRERLVDLDEDPRATEDHSDVESDVHGWTGKGKG
ncbi:hypothetical protein B0H19DRAFT_1311204 [Mycena capillaripes]|nr:hypothetical protein B0H19DRAFT_1311204 [Mycena capillaripes]